MREITIDDFKHDFGVEYFSKSIYLFHDISRIYHPEQDTLLIDIIVIIACLRGKMTITVDNIPFTLTRNRMLFLQPRQVVGKCRMSEDFKSRFLVFSVNSIEKRLYKQCEIRDNSNYLRLHPVIPLYKDTYRIFQYYYRIATHELQTANSFYKQEIIGHLLQSLLYEFLLLTDRFLAKQGIKTVSHRHTSDEEICHYFFSLLSLSHGCNRNVESYAKQISVHPDRLAAAVKAVCGHTPIKYITEETLNIITHELSDSQKTISEICYELGFTSLSSFGKYVKKHKGCSPRSLREQLRKK